MSGRWWAAPASATGWSRVTQLNRGRAPSPWSQGCRQGCNMGPCCPPQGVAVASARQCQLVAAPSRLRRGPASSWRKSPLGGRPLCQGLRSQPGTWWHHSHSTTSGHWQRVGVTLGSVPLRTWLRGHVGASQGGHKAGALHPRLPARPSPRALALALLPPRFCAP